MADDDTYNPQATDPGLVEPDMFGKLKAQWSTFMGDPNNARALLATGLALTQPPAFGDNAVSQIGRAIGHAGEAQSRDFEERRKERETDVKAERAYNAAVLAQARLGESSARTEGLKDTNAVRRERLDLDKRRYDQGIRERLHRTHEQMTHNVEEEYRKAYADWHKRATDILNPDKTTPPPVRRALPSLNEFLSDPGKFGVTMDPATGMPTTATATAPRSVPATAGGGGGGAFSRKEFDPADATILRGAATPANKTYYDEKYGPGSADEVLSGRIK